MQTSSISPVSFWRSALSWSDSVTPKVFWRVLFFTGLSVITTIICKQIPSLHLSVGLLEVSGAVIGLLLIVRINTGYDRWWEGRKLWGGIVNQSRNLAIAGLSYGVKCEKWQREFIQNLIEFPFLTIRVLREELEFNLAYLSSAKIGQLIDQGHRKGLISDPGLLAIEEQRATLIDHLGACERILKSPLPKVLEIKVRRFLMIYLALIPLGLVAKIGWYTPALMFFLSYSVLAVDQIGVELQNPFSEKNLSSLPIDDISKNIQKQVLFISNKYSFNEKPNIQEITHITRDLGILF